MGDQHIEHRNNDRLHIIIITDFTMDDATTMIDEIKKENIK